MSNCHPRKDTLTTQAAFAHIECGCDDSLDWLLADAALEAELGPACFYHSRPGLVADDDRMLCADCAAFYLPNPVERDDCWIAVSDVHGR